MKKILYFSILTFSLVIAMLYTQESNAVGEPTDNRYICMVHGEEYAIVVGHNTPCPPEPEEIKVKKHDPNDPDCPASRLPLM